MAELTERPTIILVNRCLVVQGDRLLMIQRAPTDINNPSLWEFPGGKLDKGQDIRGALEREVLEETGLIVEPTSQLAYWESFVIEKGKYPGATYIALFGIGRVVGGSLQLSAEHTDAAWTTYTEALTYDLTGESRKALIALGAAAVSGAVMPPA